ncbi:hypothetical protein [Sphingomonas sp. Root1294]|nr:hypothetical protein [Sphingomonas sp. Root1294]KQX19632.1 hypothetical protein ASD17_14100 [Sphingomonas sp. Root1294]KQY65833.1 hypothetical protein ASD39_17300 [Sphingomonas sp. Root50]KRB94860.1 hypothetical protein ASE22_02755 [Sphingomonas sp. Root720]
MATIVDAMLAAAGLHPEPADRDELIVTYAMFRPAIEALYTVPQARYEVPALAFQAAPKLKKW